MKPTTLVLLVALAGLVYWFIQLVHANPWEYMAAEHAFRSLGI